MLRAAQRPPAPRSPLGQLSRGSHERCRVVSGQLRVRGPLGPTARSKAARTRRPVFDFLLQLDRSLRPAGTPLPHHAVGPGSDVPPAPRSPDPADAHALCRGRRRRSLRALPTLRPAGPRLDRNRPRADRRPAATRQPGRETIRRVRRAQRSRPVDGRHRRSAVANRRIPSDFSPASPKRPTPSCSITTSAATALPTDRARPARRCLRRLPTSIPRLSTSPTATAWPRSPVSTFRAAWESTSTDLRGGIPERRVSCQLARLSVCSERTGKLAACPTLSARRPHADVRDFCPMHHKCSKLIFFDWQMFGIMEPTPRWRRHRAAFSLAALRMRMHANPDRFCGGPARLFVVVRAR